MAPLGTAGRRPDHTERTIARAGRVAARRWRAESRAAEEAGDIEEAYALARDALRVQPYAAWERKRAERLRDIRLGIDSPPTLAERILARVGLGGREDVSDETGGE